MRTVPIFRNDKNQTIRLPFDMKYEGIKKLEIERHGDTITLRPRRPNWISLMEQEKAGPEFLQDRADVMEMDDRFST